MKKIAKITVALIVSIAFLCSFLPRGQDVKQRCQAEQGFVKPEKIMYDMMLQDVYIMKDLPKEYSTMIVKKPVKGHTNSFVYYPKLC
jgi:uncharacterized membrane protein